MSEELTITDIGKTSDNERQGVISPLTKCGTWLLDRIASMSTLDSALIIAGIGLSMHFEPKILKVNGEQSAFRCGLLVIAGIGIFCSNKITLKIEKNLLELEGNGADEKSIRFQRLKYALLRGVNRILWGLTIGEVFVTIGYLIYCLKQVPELDLSTPRPTTPQPTPKPTIVPPKFFSV